MVTEAQIAKRSEEIAGAKHPAPISATARDCGYVLAFYRDFGDSEIRLASLMERTFPSQVAKDFRISSARYDDVAVLGVRLHVLGLLRSTDDCRTFSLTPRAIVLAGIIEFDDAVLNHAGI